MTLWSWSSQQKLVGEVGSALILALNEHGLALLPSGKDEHNSFAFSELVGMRRAPQAGKAVRKYWTEFCLNFAARVPADFAGTKVQLSGGRLHLVRRVGSRRQANEVAT